MIDVAAFSMARGFAELHDIPKVYLWGDSSFFDKDTKRMLNISFRSFLLNFDGAAEVKWQGSSTLAHPKKNFNIKLYTDMQKSAKYRVAFRDWGPYNEYTLKANYIDITQSRNVVSARLWTDVVKTRQNIPEELGGAPRLGAIDGFPVMLYLNGMYQGLYTWNIRKDARMLNVDEDNPNHAVVVGEYTENDPVAFRDNTVLDGTDWVLELPDDLEPDILASFNAAIDHVKDTDDTAFKLNFEDFFDLEASLDYTLFCWLLGAVDSLGKNFMLVTYDGQKWIPTMYDMDAVMGAHFNGNLSVTPYAIFPDDYQENNSLFFERILKLFRMELWERYEVLRQSVLSTENLINQFEGYIGRIPQSLRDEEVEIWPNTPEAASNTMRYMRLWIQERIPYVESHLRRLVDQEDPDYFENKTRFSEQLNVNEATQPCWWTYQVTVTANADAGPRWDNTADRIQAEDASHIIFQRISVKPDTDYTFSFFAKNNGSSEAKYAVFDYTDSQFVVINGSLFPSYISEINGDTYTRIVVPFHTPEGCTQIQVYPVIDSGADLDIFIWGVMVNEGDTAQEYVRG